MLKKLSTLFVACFAIALAFVATDAMAGSTGQNNLFGEVFNTTQTTFQNVRTVIFIIGGFGLIGLAFFAIFGKIQWKWFAALCVGLAIVAAAGYIIDYATGGSQTATATATGMTSWGQQGGAQKKDRVQWY